MPLKVTTWNLEHANRLISDNPSPHILDRRKRIQRMIKDISPDILCIQEGPQGEKNIQNFCSQVLENYLIPVFLKQEQDNLGDKDIEYKIKGNQWICFLVRPELLHRCTLQSPNIWQSLTQSKTWQVNYWGELKSDQHYHYRHPQVLLYNMQNGDNLELIGVHLKSKINLLKIDKDGDNNLTGKYLTDSLSARIKLATEANDIRKYIAARFVQSAHPKILLMGDCNDGPGHDYFEERYLFFDLISNLQGDVILSERFFNHALFDFPSHLRWTARYKDELLGLSAADNPLLLDHILISQTLCRGNAPLVVNENAGKVEHEAYERANSGANSKTITSDHRPVSCILHDKH
ncbi:MAG: endonuclease/exonuclease/phosphatase family protein [Candidatus Brocadiae bacterium]|nr:endonuclease/exonuclease/phosphatase family protein [Candidatus Brocadiia bacterium]